MFRHPVAIEEADIDHMGHVNNAVYLKWVQEWVIDYWRSVAPPEAVASHLWVALKHEITYRQPTFLQDVVVAEVIAERVEGVRPEADERHESDADGRGCRGSKNGD